MEADRGNGRGLGFLLRQHIGNGQHMGIGDDTIAASHSGDDLDEVRIAEPQLDAFPLPRRVLCPCLGGRLMNAQPEAAGV